MKSILLVLTAGALLASPLLAQSDSDSTNAPPPPPHDGPGGHHHMDFLTADQKAELKKAHDAAIAADPTLATEEQKVHEDMEAAHEAGGPPSQEVMEEGKAFRDKMDAAMIKADPAVAPIIAEIKAHHHGPGGPGGPPPPTTSSTSSTSSSSTTPQ